MSHVKVTSDGTPLNTKVEIDGLNLTCVTALSYEIAADGFGRCVLTLSGVLLDIEGDAEIGCDFGDVDEDPIDLIREAQ